MMLTMKTLTFIMVCSIMLGEAIGGEVCYEAAGCFQDGPPWSGTPLRPFYAQPWSPERIGIQLFLLTRENQEHHQTINYKDFNSLRASSFQAHRRTVIIIHGIDDKAEGNWVPNLCREILFEEDVNCFGVDWRKGAGDFKTYLQSINNARVVAAVVAYFLKKLQEELNYLGINVHIIGHSLGSHIAGDIGSRVPGIRRITALDAARPMFEGAEPEVRVDYKDADFVDAIHTDSEIILGFGIAEAIAHHDYYPNGGENMKGCKTLLGIDINKLEACDHLRAYQYYTHSVRSSHGFVSYPCDNYEAFTSGSCFPCPPGGFSTMGYHSEKFYRSGDLNKKFFLNTGADPPNFSSYRYKASLIINGTPLVLDQLFITFYGAGGNVYEHKLKSNLQGSGVMYTEFIDSPHILHPLHRVTFRWTTILINTLLRRQRGATWISLQAGEDGTTSSFCGVSLVLDETVQELGPCSDPNAA